MKRSFLLLLTLVMILMVGLTVFQASAQESTIDVLTERPVREVVGEKQAPLAVISPDGSSIAWAMQTGRGRNKARLLCLYTFADANKQCYDAPEVYQGYPYQLEWSPDSAHIAFSENPLQLGYESDIWLFSVGDGVFTNLTDDGVEGSWRYAEGPYALDYLPMWNEADGNIYFWRGEPVADEFDVNLSIYSVSPDGGEAQLVRDLSEYFNQQLLRFDFEFYYMDGPTAISPDGSTLAMAVSSFTDVYNTPGNGVWLLDLTDGMAEPQQVADMLGVQAAAPEWLAFPAVPVALQWTADSAGVVVMASSNDVHTPLNVFYYVDAATGEMTPVVDFSQSEDMETFFTELDASNLPERYYSPWTAAISPAGDKLLMYNNLGGLSGIMAAPLPPDGSRPAFVYETEQSDSILVTRTSTGQDGKLIMHTALFTTEE